MTKTLAASLTADRAEIPGEGPGAPLFRAGAAVQAWGQRIVRRSGQHDPGAARPASTVRAESTLVALVPAAGIGAVTEALRRCP